MQLNACPSYRYSLVSHTALSLRPPRGAPGVGDSKTQLRPRPDTALNPLAPLLNLALPTLRRLSTMDRRKLASLASLVLQTTCLVLTMRYSRTAHAGQTPYLSSTAVVTSEVLKMAACVVIIFATSSSPMELLRSEVSVGEMARLSVPSALYVVQNNLQFLAVSNLDAATFQVTYQLKLLTTALFSVLVLKKQLDRRKWVALVILTLGVALVQLPAPSHCSRWGADGSCTAWEGAGPGGLSKTEVGVSKSDMGVAHEDGVANEGQVANPGGMANDGGVAKKEGGVALVGLLAVTAMCLSSGFAGVYFEKVLKSSTQSLWGRNIQLAVSSVLLGLVAVLLEDGAAVLRAGFFQGYTWLTWLVVLQQTALGLVVSLVIKYADNILKGFASAISIVLSTCVSLCLGDLSITSTFLMGTSLVMGATMLYSHEKSSYIAVKAEESIV